MCCFIFLQEKKDLFDDLSDRFYIKFYVKGLAYNFHYLLFFFKQLEDFNRMLLFNLILLNIVN